MKPLNLPADLVHAWAAKHAAANAKLEGRELPKDYVRPAKVEEWLAQRAKPTYSKMHPLRNVNGEIVDYVEVFDD